MLTLTNPNTMNTRFTRMRSFTLKLCVALLGLALISGCATGPKTPVDDEAGLSQWQKANKRLKRGKYAKALVILDEIIVQQPKFAPAHINRGIALAGLQRNADALAALEAGLRLRPESPRTIAAAYNQAGMLYRRNQQLEAARKSYEKAVRADATFDLPHFNLALLYEQAYNQPQRALEHYARYQALQDKPDPAVRVWTRILEKDNATPTTEAATPETEATP
ncbi:MAG: hypothetical protein OXT49_01165 [Gammaproteobacteria bacterium]|nr:hypothetical protein [Gammaproteobacteria bacterium]